MLFVTLTCVEATGQLRAMPKNAQNPLQMAVMPTVAISWTHVHGTPPEVGLRITVDCWCSVEEARSQQVECP